MTFLKKEIKRNDMITLLHKKVGLRYFYKITTYFSQVNSKNRIWQPINYLKEFFSEVLKLEVLENLQH